MSHRSLLLMGSVTFALVAPARGQGLLEAIGDAIDSAMEENQAYDEGASSTHVPGHHHDHYPNQVIHPHPGNGYHPGTSYSTSQYQKVWNGSHWEYVPIAPSIVHPNVVYPNATIVSPATTVTSAAVTPNTLPYKGPGVTIALEEEVGGSVNYMIDGKESASIQAGQQQTLTSKGKYEIRFSRGKSEDGRNFGEARYTVTEGNYHFTVTDKGWELLRDKQQPNLITTQIQQASPSGIKTNALPSKTAPGVAAQPANAIPAANAAPAAPAAAPEVPAAPAANAVPSANAVPAANTVPAPAASAPAAG